jgi:uncharacterized protein YhaN
MKITKLQIERFGVWQNYSQTLNPTGLTVFYGPNEAGKTTLLRFIRGVLYGFPVDDHLGSRRSLPREPQSGELVVEHRSQEYTVRRASRGDDTGLLSITGVSGTESSSQLLKDLVAGTDEKLFESVFAVGLPELQEFATLTEDQVAQHLYGMTLGPQGQLLMKLPHRIEAELEQLWPKEHGKGRIAELTERQRDLHQQLQSGRTQRDRYRALLRNRRDLETRINQVKQRHADQQRQLRGHQFLEKVSGPWQRVRELKRELNGIPDLRQFPTDGLSQLIRFEHDRDQAQHYRDELQRDLREMSTRLRSCLGNDDIRRFAGSIRSLHDQQAQWDGLHHQMLQLEQQATNYEQELSRQVAAVGPRWNIARLERVDDSPEAHGRFVHAARLYHQTLTNTRRRQRRYKRLANACRDRELALRTELQSLGIHGTALDEPLSVARQRLDQLAELGRYQLLASESRQQSLTIDEQLQRLRDRLGLPDWVWAILGFFALAGIALVVAGVSAGVSTGWFVGLIYTVLALTAAGTTWALKLQFEEEIQAQVADLREQRSQADQQRFQADRRIRELIELHGLHDVLDPQTGRLEATDGRLLSLAADRLAQLELAQREYQRILDVRKKLSLTRGRLQGHQRELATSRKNWCDTLKSLGYDEMIDVNSAFEQWQKVTAARELRYKADDARREVRGLRLDWDRFCQKVEDLGKRMRSDAFSPQQPFAALNQWNADLRNWINGRQEYKRLVRDRRLRKSEADEAQKRLDQTQQNVAGLLAMAQATDRNDLERKLQLFQRRQQVDLLLQQAQRDLTSIAQAEKDLAIVEEDLVKFRPNENADAIQKLSRELQETDRQLQELFEQLGTIKQELKSLSADRGSCRQRLEFSQTQERLKDAWETWYADAVAADTVDMVGAMFEQANQPEMLAAAIPFVQKLTCGQYSRLWTQLGRRQLFVDDQNARPRQAEQLSGGTREQLFLAIRLAMVKAFAHRGIELPMVLDDVTVNFDQERSAAAIDTLQDFVSEGQQVLVFTSHRFFAEMFQKRGIEPIWLPGRGRGQTERRAG